MEMDEDEFISRFGLQIVWQTRQTVTFTVVVCPALTSWGPGFAPKELADLEDYYFGSDKVGRVRATNTSSWLVNPKHCSSVSQTSKNLTFPLGVYTFGGEQQGFIQGD